jgi:hypothetical protein
MRSRRLGGHGIDGDHLEKDVVAEAQQQVVRAHLGVLAPALHVEADLLAHMCRALLESRRDDREMVEGDG